MKRRNHQLILIGVVMLIAFTLWTAAVHWIDVQPIGPNGSTVGFATVNGFVHKTIGVHFGLYTITDWLGLIPIGFVLGFSFLGLTQLIQRKSLFKVDHDILALGGFYVSVFAVYFLFEKVVINYRPVLIEGVLEASYPSSTTMLALCVIPTAMLQLGSRTKNVAIRKTVLAVLAVFAAFMVIGRLISGVHWLTDIIGGALLSTGLVILYSAAYNGTTEGK